MPSWPLSVRLQHAYAALVELNHSSAEGMFCSTRGEFRSVLIANAEKEIRAISALSLTPTVGSVHLCPVCAYEGPWGTWGPFGMVACVRCRDAGQRASAALPLPAFEAREAEREALMAFLTELRATLPKEPPRYYAGRDEYGAWDGFNGDDEAEAKMENANWDLALKIDALLRGVSHVA